VLVVLTDQRLGSAPGAMPLKLLWDQRIEAAGVSYWIMASEVR